MGKVIVASGKGAYEVPLEKLKTDIDLPFSPNTLRGSEPVEVDLSSADLKVTGAVDVVSLYRVPLEGEKFLDVIVAYPGVSYVVGVGIPDKEKEGELSYLPESDEIVGKPLEEITVGEGVSPDSVVDDWKLLDSDGILDEMEELEPEEKEFIKAAVGKDSLSPEELNRLYEITARVFSGMKQRERRANFPSVYAEVSRKGLDGVKKPVTLTTEEVLSRGEKFSLNSILVGADREGNVIILYSPERVKLSPSTAVAKALNSRVPEFRALNYATGLRLRLFENRDRIEKVSKKLKELAGFVSNPEVKKVLESMASALSQNDRKAFEKALKRAFELKGKVVRKFLEEEPLFNPKDLLVKLGDKRFLRSTQVAAGIPLMDFGKIESLSLVSIPRPIKVEGEWRVQKSVKPIGALIRTPEGKLKPVEIKSDAYAMSFDYKIWKVLNALMTGDYHWKQIRALLSDGFEGFSGLGMLERDFGRYKGAAATYVDLIKYVRDVLSDVIHKTDEEIKKIGEEEARKQVAEILKNDPFINSYYSAFKSFLEQRSRKKVVNLRRILAVEEEPTSVVKQLIGAGIIFKGKDGYYHYNGEKLEANREFLKTLFKANPRSAVRYVVNTLNAALYLKELSVPQEALKDAGILYEEIKNALEFTPPKDLMKKNYVSAVIQQWKKNQPEPEEVQEVKVERAAEDIKQGFKNLLRAETRTNVEAEAPAQETQEKPAEKPVEKPQEAEKPAEKVEEKVEEKVAEKKKAEEVEHKAEEKKEVKEVVGIEEPPADEEVDEELEALFGDDVEVNVELFGSKLSEKLEKDSSPEL